MFVHMVLVKKEMHQTRGSKYELLVYRVQEAGQHRVFVAKDGFGVGDIFTASQDVVEDAKTAGGLDVVDELIAIAKDDINRNEYGLY